MACLLPDLDVGCKSPEGDDSSSEISSDGDLPGLEASEDSDSDVCSKETPTKAQSHTPAKPPGAPQKVKHRRRLQRAKARRRRWVKAARWDFRFHTTASRQRADGKCCSKGCCQAYEASGAGAIMRDFVRRLTDADRRVFVHSRIRQKRPRGDDEGYGERLNVFCVESATLLLQEDMQLSVQAHHGDLQRVCAKCFQWLLNDASNNLIYQPTVPHREFRVDVAGGQRHAFRSKPQKVLGMITWLLALAALYQHDPTNSFIYLPFCDKKLVFKLYKEDEQDPTCQHHFCTAGVAESYFYQTWREHPAVKHVKIRRWLKFALCDECVSFREERYETRDPDKLADLDRREKIHHAFVRAERHAYMTKRAVAEGPNGHRVCLSCIIDGADQSAYGLPYHFMTTHATQGAWKVKTHLMGVLAHGREAYGFTCIDNVKHGNNLTIQCLHMLLMDTWEREGTLPPTLYVQLDNTSKQCKGKYLLGFLACLVEWGLFTEVVLSFLPVGHTHEDIDQFFSQVARWLKKHNARSRWEMLRCIASSYHTKQGKAPHTGNIENVANISDWLDDNEFLADTKKRNRKHRPQSGIHKFHVFKFSSVNGSTVMQVRQWNSTSEHKDPWRALVESERYHTVFAKAPTVADLHSVPPAQRKDVTKNELQKWRTKTDKGLRKLFAARNVPVDCQEDLRRCQDMIEDRSPLPFDWDTSLYEVCESGKEPTTAPVMAVSQDRLQSKAPASPPLPAAEVPQSGCDADPDEGFDADFAINDFVFCVPAPSPTKERPFTLGCVKSSRVADEDGYEWVWMLWYERKPSRESTCPYKSIYFAQKVAPSYVLCVCCTCVSQYSMCVMRSASYLGHKRI